MTCDCCGDVEIALFPIEAAKEDQTSSATWCETCWQAPDCKTPYGGACYRHEYDEEWLWRMEAEVWVDFDE